jgi:O-antigen/teichoic acid export membrane protein
VNDFPAPPGPDGPRSGERAVQVGAVLFGLGFVGVLCVLVPFFLGRDDAPLWTTLLASLLPVGLGVALGGLLRGARANRRAARRAQRTARAS